MTSPAHLAAADAPKSGRSPLFPESARWFALATIAGPLLFALAWVVLGALRPHYSLVALPISGLGVGPNAALMNAAFVLSGLVMLVGVAGLYRRMRGLGAAARVSSAVLLGLSPVGGIVAGLFTLDAPGPHLIGAELAFMTPVLGFLVAGLFLRRIPEGRRLGTWMMVGSPLTLLLVMWFVKTFDPAVAGAGLGIAGLTQRIALVEIHAWFVALGVWATAHGAARRKGYVGPPMEGFIATWYAKSTKGNGREYEACARSVAERTVAGGSVLELAPGPGYVAIELAKLGGYRVFGLDISKTFVRIASENARASGVAIEFREGNASRMPYADESFDFVLCRAAFKNFSDPQGALDEIHRVLKPGGRASILDLRKDASREDIRAEVERMHLSRWSALWTTLTFRFFLLERAYTKDAMERMASESRFGRCEVLLQGIELDLRLAKV